MASTQSADTVAAEAVAQDSMVKPVVALVIGVALLVAAFAKLSQLPVWADEHGAVWVYLAFFVYMSIAGRLFWYGTDRLIKRFSR